MKGTAYITYQSNSENRAYTKWTDDFEEMIKTLRMIEENPNCELVEVEVIDC